MQGRNEAKVSHFGLLLRGQALGFTLADAKIGPQNGLTGQRAHEQKVGVVSLWQKGAVVAPRSAGPMCGLQDEPGEAEGGLQPLLRLSASV